MAFTDTNPVTSGRVAAPKTTSGWAFVLVVLLLLAEQSGLATALFASALPQLGAHFGTTHVVWILSLTTLVGAVVTPLAGRLADVYGKKKVLVWLSIIACAGSAISVMAASWEMMLVGRALSGTTLAFLPLSYSLIRDIFPDRMRSVAISVCTNGLGLITVIGPLLAGLLIDAQGAMAVFWPVLILSALGAVLMILFVPETSVRATGSVDWRGAALLGLGLGAFLLFVDMGGKWGWLDAKSLAVIAVSVVAVALYVQRQKTADHPLVRLDLLGDAVMARIIIAGAAAMMVVAGMASIFPMMLMTPPELGVGYGLGITATQVAFHTAPGSIMLVASGIFVGMSAKKIPFGFHIFLGGLFLAAATATLAFYHANSAGYIIAYGLMGIGGGLILAGGPNLIMSVVPQEQRGISAGMFGTATAVFNSVGAQFMFGTMTTFHLRTVEGGRLGFESAGFQSTFLMLTAFTLVPVICGLGLTRLARR